MSESQLLHYLSFYGIGIAWILVVFFGCRFLLQYFVHKLIKRLAKDKGLRGQELEQRIRTVWQLFLSIGNILIYLIAILMILKLLGFNITPILSGLGILGIALGFGAQSLIKDFISGIFMLLENQYGVGDDIEILAPHGSRGKVVKMTIRSTILKDKTGRLHYISNGSITNIVNYSKKYSSETRGKSLKKRH
mgnify:CR=1 FL=1